MSIANNFYILIYIFFIYVLLFGFQVTLESNVVLLSMQTYTKFKSRRPSNNKICLQL